MVMLLEMQDRKVQFTMTTPWWMLQRLDKQQREQYRSRADIVNEALDYYFRMRDGKTKDAE